MPPPGIPRRLSEGEAETICRASVRRPQRPEVGSEGSREVQACRFGRPGAVRRKIVDAGERRRMCHGCAIQTARGGAGGDFVASCCRERAGEKVGLQGGTWAVPEGSSPSSSPMSSAPPSCSVASAMSRLRSCGGPISPLVRGAVADAGGEKVKSLGDGLMVAFASPLDALTCAVGMQRAIAEHNCAAPPGARGTGRSPCGRARP